jgi:hypothetical protein
MGHHSQNLEWAASRPCLHRTPITMRNLATLENEQSATRPMRNQEPRGPVAPPCNMSKCYCSTPVLKLLMLVHDSPTELCCSTSKMLDNVSIIGLAPWHALSARKTAGTRGPIEGGHCS